MKDITKKLIMGGAGVTAMALVGALLGRKDKSEEAKDENEIEVDADLVPDEVTMDEETSDENVED